MTRSREGTSTLGRPLHFRTSGKESESPQVLSPSEDRLGFENTGNAAGTVRDPRAGSDLRGPRSCAGQGLGGGARDTCPGLRPRSQKTLPPLPTALGPWAAVAAGCFTEKGAPSTAIVPGVWRTGRSRAGPGQRGRGQSSRKTSLSETAPHCLVLEAEGQQNSSCTSLLGLPRVLG